MYYWIRLKNASNDICLFHNCQPLWCTCRQVQQVLQATRVWNKGKHLGEPCSLVLFGAKEIRSDGCSEPTAQVATRCSLDRRWQTESLLRIPHYRKSKYLNPVKDIYISAWTFASHQWLFKSAKQQWQHTWKINAFCWARIMWSLFGCSLHFIFTSAWGLEQKVRTLWSAGEAGLFFSKCYLDSLAKFNAE